jgi:hypothetical protein
MGGNRGGWTNRGLALQTQEQNLASGRNRSNWYDDCINQRDIGAVEYESGLRAA